MITTRLRKVITVILGVVSASYGAIAHPSSPAPVLAGTSECSGCVRVATWVAPQVDLSQPMALEFPGRAGISGANDTADINVGPAFPKFRNQTLRQVAHLSAGGEGFSIKFSNLFGTSPLTLDKVRVAKSAGRSAISPGTSRPVLFDGHERVTIGPGMEVTSDDITMEVAPLTTLVVSTFMANSFVQSGNFMRGSAYVGEGDLTEAPSIKTKPRALSAYFITQIDVIRRSPIPVVVAFGDSITYGWSSTPDAYSDYPSKLSELLNATTSMSVVNAGYPGSRWVYDYFGPSGISRFRRDVLDVPGVTHVVILLGINDIGVGFTRSRETNNAAELAEPERVIATLRMAIEAAKSAGLHVYVGTLMPWKGFSHFTSGASGDIPGGRNTPYNGEQVRQAINEFIRTNPSIDKVIDFDLAFKDPADAQRQKASLTADHLHPSDTGYTEMAKLVFDAIVPDR